MLVSIIMPMFNAAAYLDEALHSIIQQTWKISLEVSIFNDASNDDSVNICKKWEIEFEKAGIHVVIGHNVTGKPGGVGYAKNRAILQSSGSYLCFLDSDDVMTKDRIEMQLPISEKDDTVIVGSCYERLPEGSTTRYQMWSNGLTNQQLYMQIYTSFGPTLINPTWFCSRKVYDRSGPFSEVGKGFPEDLAFFFQHLDNGGKLYKVDKHLLIYRYHQSAATFSVHENTIWNIRMGQIQKDVINSWSSFTIWNAGKQGRKFFRSLNTENRSKVSALCDVDVKKIEKGVYTCELIKGEDGKPLCIPIIHFQDAKPPFIICVKLNFTNGQFEENLKSLNLLEGRDYYHFN